MEKDEQAVIQLPPAMIASLTEQLEGDTFHHCISNPPYQESAQRENGSIAQAQNIFHHFYTMGISLASTTTMIFPGGRWMQRGSRAAHGAILPTARKVHWYPNSTDTPLEKRIFPGVDITDGVSIVVGGRLLTGKAPSPTLLLNGVELLRPSSTGILPLGRGSAELLSKLPLERNIMGRRSPTAVFGLRTYYVERNPEKVARALDSHGVLLPAPSRFPDPLLAHLGNEVPGSGKKSELYWIDGSSIHWGEKNRRELATAWKVVMSQAGANKNPEKRRLWVVPAGVIVGETLNIMASFPTEDEAVNFTSYMSTPLVRSLLAMGKGGHSKALGIFVPDLGDYSSSNPLFMEDGELEPGHEYRGLSLEGRLVRHFSLSGGSLLS